LEKSQQRPLSDGPPAPETMVSRDHHADERSFLLFRANERNTGIEPSQEVAIRGVDAEKRKAHVFASFPKQKVGKPQPLLFRFPLCLLAGFSAFSVPTSFVGRVLRFSFTIITEIHPFVNQCQQVKQNQQLDFIL
jgi:hypothetical protein